MAEAIWDNPWKSEDHFLSSIIQLPGGYNNCNAKLSHPAPEGTEAVVITRTKRTMCYYQQVASTSTSRRKFTKAQQPLIMMVSYAFLSYRRSGLKKTLPLLRPLLRIMFFFIKIKSSLAISNSLMNLAREQPKASFVTGTARTTL